MVKKQYIKAEIRTLNSQTCNMLATSKVDYAGSNRKSGGPTQAETKRSMWDDEEEW